MTFKFRSRAQDLRRAALTERPPSATFRDCPFGATSWFLPNAHWPHQGRCISLTRPRLRPHDGYPSPAWLAEHRPPYHPSWPWGPVHGLPSADLRPSRGRSGQENKILNRKNKILSKGGGWQKARPPKSLWTTAHVTKTHCKYLPLPGPQVQQPEQVQVHRDGYGKQASSISIKHNSNKWTLIKSINSFQAICLSLIVLLSKTTCPQCISVTARQSRSITVCKHNQNVLMWNVVHAMKWISGNNTLNALDLVTEIMVSFVFALLSVHTASWFFWHGHLWKLNFKGVSEE